MKQTSKFKKLTTMLIIVLAIIMLQSSAFAAYIIASRYNGDKKIDYDLARSQGIYCLDENTSITSPTTYYEKAHIKIVGRHATGSVTSDNITNAKMAYILSYGNVYKGHGTGHAGTVNVRQAAVWYYSPIWLRSIGLGAYAHTGKVGRNKGYSAVNSGEYKGADYYANNVDSLDEVYTVDIRILRSNKSTQDLILVKTGTEKQAGELVVNKVDGQTGESLRAGFKVQTRVNGKTYWLAQNSNGTYNYTASNGTTFYTDGGTKQLKSLSIKYQYKVWETEAPNGDYPLADQNGYDSGMKAVKLSDWVTLKSNKAYTIKAPNERKISIAGYVWVDKTVKGDEKTDNVYKDNSGDTRLSGVTVNLVRKSDKRVIASTKSANNGSYRFDKAVLYKDLDNYYVEFDYSNMTIDGRAGKEYIPVAYSNANISNGSRALMDEVARKDKDLKGIATTYPNNDSRYLSTYGLKALSRTLYNKSTKTIENVNLGIRPIYKPEYSITEDLSYVKILLNNHEYIYYYDGDKIETAVGAPKVNFANPAINGVYERAVYPSAIYDLMERGEDTNGTLEVYVVYGISIANTTKHDDEDIYKEQKLHITNLTNTFDENRYVFDPTVNSIDGTNSTFKDGEEKIKAEFSNWNVNGNKATYKGNITVTNNKPALVHIQLKVKADEIKRILENKKDGIVEKTPTVAESIGYHEYTRKDYSWKTLPDLPKTQTHETTEQTDSDSAKGLKFKLGQERKVSGIVFEDGAVKSDDGQLLGNGHIDIIENKRVQGVKVELLNANTNELAKLYIEDKNDKGYSIKDAVLEQTGADGKFVFEGVMPGLYYIRLTYANGEQCLIMPDGKIVSMDEYKSTIVTAKAAREALQNALNGKDYNKEWYKQLEGKNYSVAVDSLSRRLDYNKGKAEINSMLAATPVIDITIENTETNFGAEQVNNFDVFNFGIVVQPRQKVEIEKVIEYITLVNSPTYIVDGNPEKDNLPGVTDLDGNNNNGGSTYARMEVEEKNIYGSVLTLIYNIKVKNASDLMFYETEKEYLGWYYMFGDTTHGKPVKLNIEEIIDDFDKELSYLPDDNKNITLKDDEHNLLITGFGDLENGSEKNIKVKFEKILSTDEVDLNYKNIAKVNKVTTLVDEKDKDNKVAEESLGYIGKVVMPDQALAEAVVTPPTGNATVLIVITSIIAGIALLVLMGIIVAVIRKKK